MFERMEVEVLEEAGSVSSLMALALSEGVTYEALANPTVPEKCLTVFKRNGMSSTVFLWIKVRGSLDFWKVVSMLTPLDEGYSVLGAECERIMCLNYITLRRLCKKNNPELRYFKAQVVDQVEKKEWLR